MSTFPHSMTMIFAPLLEQHKRMQGVKTCRPAASPMDRSTNACPSRPESLWRDREAGLGTGHGRFRSRRKCLYWRCMGGVLRLGAVPSAGTCARYRSDERLPSLLRGDMYVAASEPTSLASCCDKDGRLVP